MSGHTPGPWSLPHFAEPEASCECGYVLTEERFGAIATVHASGDSDDIFAHGDNPKFAEAVANARLIAAAPDLLAALLEAQGALLGYDGHDKNPMCAEDWADQDGYKAYAKARAAIAKATKP